MNSAITLREIHTIDEAAVVEALAREIWTDHYRTMQTAEEIEYMLRQFQTKEAICRYMAEGMRYYLLLDNKQPVGYFAYETDGKTAGERKLFLSKLYLLKSARGQGAARLVLDHILRECQAHRLDTIWLKVNKHNPTVAIYQKLGFACVESVFTDIGNGYLLDDYVMERPVSIAASR